MERELLRFAVGRAIFCPDCETVLDTDSAVLYSPKDSADPSCTPAVCCAKCSDAARDKLRSIDEAVLLARYDIYDGRRYA